MGSAKSKGAAPVSAADSTAAVDAFLAGLEHPCKALVQEIRVAILAVDPSIAEGIKWNAPSYRTTEYFATTNLREKAGVGIVLHRGAKVREVAPGEMILDDPSQLLKWLAKDRAIVVFRDSADFAAKHAAFAESVRQWIRWV
jgi:hypothetical protein